MVYGCEKFHTYLFCHSFTVNTYHKPFKSIHLKHLTAALPRLQGMLQRLQPYDHVTRYQPGKSIEMADALSRLSPEEKEPIPGMNVQVHDIIPRFSNSILQRIREQTASDPERNALKEMIHSAWLAVDLPATPSALKTLLALS